MVETEYGNYENGVVQLTREIASNDLYLIYIGGTLKVLTWIPWIKE